MKPWLYLDELSTKKAHLFKDSAYAGVDKSDFIQVENKLDARVNRIMELMMTRSNSVMQEIRE